MKQRVEWLDAVKCFGIFAIFWGHYGVDDGHAVRFVFEYHVPLFFLISGCSEYLIKGEGIGRSLKRIFSGLLVPWLFFCIASVVIDVLETDCEMVTLWPSIWKILQGTPRNSFVAWGLWFLTCLAVIKFLFAFLRRLRSKIGIFCICLAVHMISLRFADIKNPTLPFNADCAMYYLLYFGIGYVGYPWINQILNTEKMWGKVFLGISFCASAGFCAYLYFGRNLFEPFFAMGLIGQNMLLILTALAAIWFHILLAFIFRDVELFQKMGRNTLYLCGSEHPVRVLLYLFLEMAGLPYVPKSSLASLIYTMLTLWFANNCLVPVEKYLIGKLLSAADYFKIHASAVRK